MGGACGSCTSPPNVNTQVVPSVRISCNAYQELEWSRLVESRFLQSGNCNDLNVFLQSCSSLSALSFIHLIEHQAQW